MTREETNFFLEMLKGQQILEVKHRKDHYFVLQYIFDDKTYIIYWREDGSILYHNLLEELPPELLNFDMFTKLGAIRTRGMGIEVERLEEAIVSLEKISKQKENASLRSLFSLF